MGEHSTVVGAAVVAALAWIAPRTAAQQAAELRIRAAAGDPGRVAAVFEEVCDRLAPRLTGSAALDVAAARCRAAFAELGLAARIETWELPVGWSPGAARVRVLAPVVRELEAVAAGWCPPTDGAVEATLAVGAVGSGEGLAVLLEPPLAAGRAVARPHPAADAAVVLVDGGRPWAAVPAIAAPFAAAGVAGAVPTAAIAAEDAAWLRRLAAGGGEVRLAVEIGGALEPAREVPDVIADLAGRDGDDAGIVLAVAGYDTWHLGAGAVATGTDVAILLEAARLLRAAEAAPRRTIRFALLAGSQQGFGTSAYVRRHAAALDRHAGGFALEGGSGSITGVQLAGHAAALPDAESWFAPVAALGATDVGLRAGDGAMPQALQRAGVPVYAVARPAPVRDLLRGTRADTADKVAVEELERAAVVLATALWRLADAEVGPPRFPTGR